MYWYKLFGALLVFLSCTKAAPSSLGSRVSISQRQENGQTNQSLVTWDEHSFMVRGERLFLFGGEFHPFRLPVLGLWLDIFEKIKAMGFNTVSFYTYWGLQEGDRGHVVTDGIWDLKPFFDAASEAGIYLIARPGPYINAETAAGGMPGWTLRMNATLRSNDPEYTDSIKLYMQTIGKQIAAAQITKGGPVILAQPENEYTTWPDLDEDQFPARYNREYMAFVEEQLIAAGIEVPLVMNDNEVMGYFAPGTGLGSVDIYGIDAYPMRYDCAHPHIWPNVRFPRDWQIYHEEQSPTTPFTIPEFQGGSGTGWGPDSVNQNMCNALVNEESVRVLFKNNYSFGVKLLSIYMTYGGTNWGNLGFMGGDSSYDYGAAITEDRQVWREKYSEEKLEANFLKVSPAYLTAVPGNASNGSYTSTDALTTTPVLGTELSTNFYMVRHANWTSLAHTPYTITVPMGSGNITLPQLGSQLSINGRDAKIHVTNYDVGGVNMVYCTADIMTWAKGDGGKRVLVMYGGEGETHEFAFDAAHGKPQVSGSSTAKVERRGSTWVVQWTVTAAAQTLQIPGCDLEVRMLWRNDAYNYWVLELPAADPIGMYSSPSKSHVIVKGGYLLRTAEIEGTALRLTGDINATTDFELVHEPTDNVQSISFNGEAMDTSRNENNKLQGTLSFQQPTIILPDFTALTWKSIDSLPELSSSYDDTPWTSCNNQTTTNDKLGLQTPTSLFASDYGYHTGSLIYRGHFLANGGETNLWLNVSGGYGFGHSVWLNQAYLGHWGGDVANMTYSEHFPISQTLESGQEYVITVLIDHMGQTEEGPGTDDIKFPFGILNYTLSGHEQSDITWKMTGNLGGEQYRDHIRGPRNEGAMYAERQGYHLPSPPTDDWDTTSPMTGLQKAGVHFYSTTFHLNLPHDHDTPLSFRFNDGTYNANGSAYRIQLFVNGYQFGKYVHNLGPQTDYPVPEGILNYEGENWIGVTLWAQEAEGAKLESLELVAGMVSRTGYERPALAPQPGWTRREGAY